ncbi:MAG: hypothetical protein ABGY75_08925 [Gemmataceae bacterium]
MRGFLLRSLKTAVPTALVLAGCGYLFAHATAAVAATQTDSGEALRDTLTARLPFTFAAWGGGMVLVFELFRTLWKRPPAPVVKGPADTKETAALLDHMLAAAETAETARMTLAPPVSVSDVTPPPRRDPLPRPLPELDFPLHDPPQ